MILRTPPHSGKYFLYQQRVTWTYESDFFLMLEVWASPERGVAALVSIDVVLRRGGGSEAPVHGTHGREARVLAHT